MSRGPNQPQRESEANDRKIEQLEPAEIGLPGKESIVVNCEVYRQEDRGDDCYGQAQRFVPMQDAL
ncbi:MAG: hypothetical protein QGG09_14145, partial [Pirellulaceae bacterium]|nr:hypothetical protein [Pirellulaceae bacterium]